MTSTLCQTLIYKPPSKPGVGVVCRRLAAPQGHEYKSIAVSFVLAPVRCCVCRCSYWLSCVLWRYVHASRVDTAAVRAAAVCPPPLSVLAAHSIAADTALQNTMVSCNIALMRFLHFKGGVMITKTFAINYLHLYGVFCNAPCLF